MEGFQDESAEFSIEQVEHIIREAIKATLHDTTYNPKKINEWTNMIVGSCLKSLQELSKPFKYVITCMIMQKNGAGVSTATSMFWDTAKDGNLLHSSFALTIDTKE
jgi:dynein light chain Tctex-type 1